MFGVLMQVAGALVLVVAALCAVGFMGVYATVSPYEIQGGMGRRKGFLERVVDTFEKLEEMR